MKLPRFFFDVFLNGDGLKKNKSWRDFVVGS